MSGKKVNIEKIIEVKEKLELLLPYMTNKNTKMIVKWAKEDINEIFNIQKRLTQKKICIYSYKFKNTIDFNVHKSNSVEKDIMNVYRKIEKELNYWRMLELKLKVGGKA